jgi:membrane-associated phospholipid phosphatase
MLGNIGRRLAITAGVSLSLAGWLIWRLEPAIDWQIHQKLLLPASSPLLPWLLRFTTLGSGVVLIPVALIACLALALTHRRREAIWLFATIASGRLLIELAKFLFDRQRPPLADHLESVTSLSFPSSHSAGSALTCFALCLAFRAAPLPSLLAGLFVIAIGMSRIVLGVHWPSDVIAGWGMAIAWIAFCARARR